MTQYPQQQPAQFRPPMAYPRLPKKKHTVRNVFLVLLVASVLSIGGCMAFLASAGNELAKSVDESTARNAPQEVTVGKAFSVGKHQTLAGWTVSSEAGMFSVAGKVTNVSDMTSTAFLHFKFVSKTGEVLGNVQCNSSDLEPGQTQALNCVPDGQFSKAYAKVTAEATF